MIPSDSAKSGKALLVPLSAAAVRLLQSVPRLGEYVWTNDGKSPIGGFAKLKQRLDGFLAASGGELQPWVLHDLRRTVATHMVRPGVTETIVGRVLNHAAEASPRKCMRFTVTLLKSEVPSIAGQPTSSVR